MANPETQRRVVTAAAIVALLALPVRSQTVARLSSIDVITNDHVTMLRLTANGPIAWRELSGAPASAAIPSPLRLKLYGVTLGALSATRPTALGRVEITPEGRNNLILTLTSDDELRYRIHSGRSANIVEIEIPH